MNINDKKIIEELKIVIGYLNEIDTDKLGYYNHINLIKCETTLRVLLNLMECDENK